MTLAKKQSKFLGGRRIDPKPITGKTKLVDLVDSTFVAYNAARLREACWLFSQKMLEPDVTVGVTLTGALASNVTQEATRPKSFWFRTSCVRSSATNRWPDQAPPFSRKASKRFTGMACPFIASLS